MSPVQRTNRDQKGQTTVEYVLLIFVTIVVTLGLLRIFSSSVNIFTQNFFGSYVQCLIISGELPTLNSDSSSGCAMPQFVFDSGEFSQADNGGTDGG
ncbi:MAG: hypothetical protein KDD25_10535, partial [Bdellovibrionales bacterium]|nr:hypothetical protein [Bdellovibrionales bacterium]